LPPRFELGLTGGLAWSGSPGALTGRGALDGGARLGDLLSLRAAVAVESSSGQRETDHTVEQQRSTALLGLGLGLGRGPWLRPSILAGASLVRVTVDDLALARWRVVPTAAVVLSAGVDLGSTWALRADLGGTLYLLSERYFTGADQVAARSPRGALWVGVGLEWRSR
jgi:hypothetical protein